MRNSSPLLTPETGGLYYGKQLVQHSTARIEFCVGQLTSQSRAFLTFLRRLCRFEAALGSLEALVTRLYGHFIDRA